MNLKNITLIATILAMLLGAIGCNDPWDEHYKPTDERADMKLWDAIRAEPRFSAFVEEVESLSLDTIFNRGTTQTIFIPDNEALSEILDTALNPEQILLYCISPTLSLPGLVTGQRRLQTMNGKYLLFEANGDEISADGVPIIYTSPLYQDGKYYELNGVISPTPNLYEYTAQISQTIKKYIDSRDSVFLDLSLSRPIGFDAEGNTVYDSVFGNVNLFEEKYFPVSKEFRSEDATFILFTQEQYITALEEMASVTGISGGIDGIPEKWQFEELMPKLMENALFEGLLDYSDLMKGRLESITGDSVDVDYENIDPDSKYICSNGLSYLYYNFSIDSDLYLKGIQVEGESLIDTLGAGSWTWKDGVITTGKNVSPLGVESVLASNGSILNAPFSRGYTGAFSLQFTIRNVLPLKYRLVWSSNFRPSGIFAIYVNDVNIGEFDSFKFRSTVLSVTGEYFRPVEGFNKKDFWVENLTEFGDVTIRFDYLGPGGQDNNGLNIDYVKLIPVI